MILTRTIAKLALVLALLCVPGVSPAETARQKARGLFKAGNALYLKGDYEGALRKYRAARSIYPNYKIDLNIANTLDDLRRPAEAVEEYEKFLRQAESRAPAELIRKTRARMEELKERLKRERQRKLEAARGATPGGPSGKPREPGAASAEASTATQKSSGSAAEDRDSRRAVKRKRHTILAWSSLGLGIASAATAGVLYGVGMSRRSAAYDNYSAARDQVAIDGHWEEVEAEEKKLIAGHVLAGVAAAAVGVSAYFFITRPSADGDADQARGALRMLVGGTGQGAGVLISGTF